MHKDFDTWNETKKGIDAHEDYLPLYHERQVRWCRLGLNIGYEQDGTGQSFSRPVLVLKGFSRRVCLVVPLTTSSKKNPYHVALGEIGGRKAYAIISQLRLIDTRRLDTLIEALSEETFMSVIKAVKDML